MKKGFKVVINNNANSATIYIYGAISDWDVSALNFVQEYKRLKQEYASVTVRMNCPGGEVFEGFPIFTAIKSDNENVQLYIDGLSASMGFVIAMAFKKENRHISKYAKCMTHLVSGQASGSSQQIMETAKMMETLDNDLVDILSKDTGKTADEVRNLYLKEGVNNWMTAQQCVDAGFVADIFDGDPTLVPSNFSPIEIKNFFNQEPKTENNMKNLAMFVAVFAAANITLPADATEDVVLAKVKDVLEKNKTLLTELAAANKKLEDAKTKEITDMVNAAEKAKKITAQMVPHYVDFAKANFDSCKKVLDEMKPYEPISNMFGKETSQTNDARKDWKFSDWQKKDPKGLAKMKAENPDGYKSLLETLRRDV